MALEPIKRKKGPNKDLLALDAETKNDVPS